MKKSIISVVIVIAIAILLITIVFTRCFEEKKDSENNQNTDDSENNQNDEETEYDAYISLSTNKKEYNSGEEVNIFVLIKNKMDRSFPFGDYRFGLKYVNKSEYDLTKISGNLYSPKDIPWDLINSITVAAGETYMYNVSWDTTDIDSGDYYIQFEIQKVNPDSSYIIEDKVMAEITIT